MLPKKAQMSTSVRRQLIVDDASKRWGTPNICFLYTPPTCSTLAKGHGGPSKDKVLQLFSTSALKTTLNIWWFCDWIDNLLSVCIYEHRCIQTLLIRCMVCWFWHAV
ncbi:hypothetical protein OIU85_014672 [Salix viminalis]|uniref:Uncharacterized protein n=1 Tax=Salix viminalis TaxID=40686 RepID=A0A9Q0NJ79_SALVM|nr:hypothetical protein OIU85_014672 [Salix viminalis]